VTPPPPIARPPAGPALLEPGPQVVSRRFLRAFLRALTDEATYDIRANPSLWLGFLLAIPIPLLAFTADADTWLKLFSLPAPVTWAIVLGAAGRVGILAQQESRRLAGAMEQARSEAQTAQESLGRERTRRRELESERAEVISELKLAQAVQATLLPAPIQRPEVEVVVRAIPTRYIGGDYAHAIVLEGRWLYLILFDVSGHGISAALVVARLHGLVRRLTLTKKSPETILERLNTAAQTLLAHTYFFMTAVVMRLDLQSGTLEYCTAGHPAQVLLRRNDGMETLRTPNRLMGVDPDIFDAERPVDRVQLEPGDTIVLFTDGLFEVLKGGEGEVLGEQGLYDRLRGTGALAPSLLVGEVLQELSEFQGSSEFDDDVTLVAARWNGAATPAS
jgi:sigma-B regulation protein RsbU (phosphoserine phosphatase)